MGRDRFFITIDGVDTTKLLWKDLAAAERAARDLTLGVRHGVRVEVIMIEGGVGNVVKSFIKL